MNEADVPALYRRVARLAPTWTHTDRCRFISDCGNLPFERVHELTLETDIDDDPIPRGISR